MGGFKRFCMFVYSLASILGVTMLALTWVGPWTKEVSALLVVDGVFIACEACVALCLVGLLVMLVRSVFSRGVRSVEVSTVNGGKISVTRDAIASQAAHIVEADGSCIADRVSVSAKKRGRVRVHVRVLPHSTIDVVAKGAELHQALLDGLAAVCGDKVDRVTLEFVEPEAVTVPDHDEAAQDVVAAPVFDHTRVAEDVPATDATDEPTSEITVPMGGTHEATEREA